MKLINSHKENGWIIVDEVSSDDAAVLQACGFRYVYDVDENGTNREDGGKYSYELWDRPKAFTYEDGYEDGVSSGKEECIDILEDMDLEDNDYHTIENAIKLIRES